MTGSEHKTLYFRLLEMFPKRASLEAFVRHELNENLESISSANDPITDSIFKLVDWAERTGRLPDIHTATAHTASVSRAESSTPQIAKIWTTTLPTPRGRTFGRDGEKQALTDYLAAPRTNVVAIVGLGGCGKSQLVQSWLDTLSPAYAGAERIFGWSFYAQGTGPQAAVSSEEFFARAFDFFNAPIGIDDPPGRANALAQAIRRHRTILVLDGLEPFQDPSSGEIRDRALKYLVKDLTTAMNGLCVITTRPPFEALDGHRGETFERIDLPPLDQEAGAALLRYRDLRGSDVTVHATVQRWRGHPLCLAVLGNYVHDVWYGDLERAETDISALVGEDDHRLARLLTSYDRHFDGARRSVLRALALYDRPAPLPELDLLRSRCAHLGADGDHGWNRAVSALVKADILSSDRIHLDIHPLIRGHFARVFEEEDAEAFHAAHGLLFDHLCAAAPARPTTFAEMSPLFRAVVHGCQARRWGEALGVLQTRIRQGDQHFSLKKLGAVSADLAAFACFFTAQWEPVPELSPTQRHWLQNSAGVLHRAAGSLVDAEKLLAAAVRSGLAMRRPDLAAGSARNLASTLSAMGRLAEALEITKEAISFADESGELRSRIVSRHFYAHLLNRRGLLSESRAMFAEVIHLQHDLDPAGDLRHYPGASYVALLVELGETQEALHRARQDLEMTHDDDSERGSLLDVALTKRSLARALAAVDSNDEASRLFDESIEHLRQAARQDHLAPGLLDRARFLLTLDSERAALDIHDALAIAVPRGFRLVEADAYLTRARLEISLDTIEVAEASLDHARNLLIETGFDLRVPMLRITEALLHAARGRIKDAEDTLWDARRRIDAMGMLSLHRELGRARTYVAIATASSRC